MPQTKFDERCTTETRKCDVPVANFVTYEIKDDSSPEISPTFSGFFPSGQPSKSGVSQVNGRTTEDNKTLSVLSNDCNQEDISRDTDLDLLPSNLLNGHCSKNEIENQYKCDTSFSDSLLSSLIIESLNENSMKITNDPPVNENFSDFLSSISFPNHESKNDSKQNFEVSYYSDDTTKLGDFTTQSKGPLSDILSSISLDEHDSSQTSNKLSSHSNRCFKVNQSSKLDQTNESNHGTLSDILSAISFDKIETSMQNGFISSSNSSMGLDDFKISNLNEQNPDFPTINCHVTDNTSKLDAPNLESNGNLSDMLSSIIFHENDNTGQSGLRSSSFSSSNQSQDFESDSLFTLKELSCEYLKSDAKVATDKPADCDILTLPSIMNNISNNIQNTLLSKSHADNKPIAASSISAHKTSDHDKTSIHDKENQEFSFFTASPDSAFSAMISNLGKASDSQDKNTDECAPQISMLDLLKSVNTDSNGSLYQYLNNPSESKETKTDKQAANIVFDELLDIDLTACIKTNDDSLNNTLNNEPLKNEVFIDEKDNTEIILGGFMKPVFDDIDSTSPKPRMNLNQSLFAKSLSCKPKKNQVLLRKVALIKSELYKHYFNHNISDEGELTNIKGTNDDGTGQGIFISNTNDCMIRFKGRRLCPQEVH